MKLNPYCPKEFKVVSLRDCAPLESSTDTPAKIYDYWLANIATDPAFRPEQEQLYVFLLNSRLRLKGHTLIGLGTLTGVVMSPMEVFRAAVVSAAFAIVVAHNHPSGDPTPSEADIRVTREMISAGQVLKINVVDHVVIGTAAENRPLPYASLREMGYFQ